MEFCPSCGSRLIYKLRGKTGLFCQKCGYQSEFSTVRFFRNPTVNNRSSTSGLVILDRRVQSLNTFPTVSMLCPKCGGKTSETWTMEFGSEDNSQATFFRCTTCKYTRREIG